MPAKPTAIPIEELNVVECPDDAHWEQWLQEHHATAADAWVKMAVSRSPGVNGRPFSIPSWRSMAR